MRACISTISPEPGPSGSVMLDKELAVSSESTGTWVGAITWRVAG